MFEHGGFGHAWTLYQEVLAVPLFVKLPGQRNGQVVEETVSLLDIFPTILEATGQSAPLDFEGSPLQSLLRGSDAESERAHYFSTGWAKRCIARGVREGPWKLISIRESYDTRMPKLMLFNLAEDPAELNDVADDHPEVVERLSAKIEERFAFYRAHRMQSQSRASTALDEDALRALGYVE